MPHSSGSTERVLLGVPVQIVRRRQKNMYLTVREGGSLRVTCPPDTADAAVDRFVLAHADWLRDAMAKISARRELQKAASGGGGAVPVWGRALPLHVRAARPYGVFLSDDALVMNAPGGVTAEETAALLASFRRAQLNAAVPPLLEKWQPVLGVQAATWHGRDMRTRWGSCNTRTGRLCFNTQLTALAPQCLEYVVVHELCHLLVPDHSHAFWAQVARCLPNWTALRKMTNDASAWKQAD